MTNNTNIYAVIMAGGGGTRFWPLSRKEKPKQFLNLTGNDVMINETVNRLMSDNKDSGLVLPENIFIVTNKDQVVTLNNVLTSLVPRDNILAEPLAKNTAPCILYAALHILKTRGMEPLEPFKGNGLDEDDGVICVFPADHYIADCKRFVEVLRKAVDVAANTSSMVTIGIPPTYPSTGYGYIKTSGASDTGLNYHKIEKFIEKPNATTAAEYIQDGGYFWNAGIFVCRVSVIINLYALIQPVMTRKLVGVYKLPDMDKTALESAYISLESISIDYGIMERLDNALMLEGDFGWNDIGSWDALGAVIPADENGNVIKATQEDNHIGIDTEDCVIYQGMDKLTATIGLKDVIVVDTEDALLVCAKDRAQEIKSIIERLRKASKTDVL